MAEGGGEAIAVAPTWNKLGQIWIIQAPNLSIWSKPPPLCGKYDVIFGYN